MFRRDFVHEQAIHHTLTVAYKQGCTKLRKTVYKLAKGNQANIVENLYDVPEEALLLEIGAAVVRLEAPVLPGNINSSSQQSRFVWLFCLI